MDFIDWAGIDFGGAEFGALFAYFCLLSIFLIIGKILRVKVNLFQKVFLPASVIGGFIGLIMGPYVFGEAIQGMAPALYDSLLKIRIGFGSLPGRLIDIVFATMFLGLIIPKGREILKKGGPQLAYSMIVGAPMQYFIAALLTMVVLIPLFNVDPTFATLLEIGFAGGHGTAGGMAPLFREGIADMGWHFPAGADLAFTSATVGILTATIVGIAIINIGTRKGYAKNLQKPEDLPEEKRVGIIPPNKRYSISTATVSPESIEPFAFHLAIVFVAIFIGYVIDTFLARLGIYLGGVTGNTTLAQALQIIPAFPLCMMGGIIVQIFLTKTKRNHLIDRASMERIQGLALEFLVVSAIASISIPILIEYAAPFFILMAVGIAYIAFATWYIAPRMLPDSWFERSMVEFGMQTGVTAMGIMLLRIVDPGFKTESLEAFGFKQIAYEPFFGGGFVTAMTPLLVLVLGLPKFAVMMLVIAIIFGFLLPMSMKWIHKHPKPYR